MKTTELMNFLKEYMITKEDLKHFATKEDLLRVQTDITKQILKIVPL